MFYMFPFEKYLSIIVNIKRYKQMLSKLHKIKIQMIVHTHEKCSNFHTNKLNFIQKLVRLIAILVLQA